LPREGSSNESTALTAVGPSRHATEPRTVHVDHMNGAATSFTGLRKSSKVTVRRSRIPDEASSATQLATSVPP
jgi:hypothetical protein